MKWMEKIKNIFKMEEEEERSIILDTCALETKLAMNIIENSPKIILLTGILDEMDKYKKEPKLLGHNIREITRKSREDKNGEKYVCVAGYDSYSYNDKNIIDYCRKHRKTTILTSDNILCNYAKAYKIDYIFAEDKEEKVSKAKKTTNTSKTNNVGQNVKGVIYKSGKLYYPEDRRHMKFMLFKNEKYIENNSEEIELQIGDILYTLKRTENSIALTKYEIQEICEYNYAVPKFSERIEPYEKNSKKMRNFPKEVQNKILTFFEQIEEKEEDNEFYFYNKWINQKRNSDTPTEIKIEREGKLIPAEEYQAGDYIWLLKYNVAKRYMEISLYKIILENGKYDVQCIDQTYIYYLNQIYRLDVSEELHELIREFFIKNIEC